MVKPHVCGVSVCLQIHWSRTNTHTEAEAERTNNLKKSKMYFKQSSEKLLYLRMYECYYECDLQRKC